MILAALATVAHSAPSHGFVSPAILPRIDYAAPDVTVVKQPYVVHQTEPVYRHVYYASDPVAHLQPAVSFAPASYQVAYRHQPAVAATAVYHAAPSYQHAVGYVV